jgi:hypothetical protein
VGFTDRLKKGAIGEAIVDRWLRDKGWVPYRPVDGCAHPFDRLVASANKRKLCIVEVKTKPRREAYRDTGIERRHFDDYDHVTSTYSIPLFLAFVDERERRVYGNWWSILLQRRPSGRPFPEAYPWTQKGIVYFPLSIMRPIAELSDEQCRQLEALRSSAWVESFA